jgi:hypothetical protein
MRKQSLTTLVLLLFIPLSLIAQQPAPALKFTAASGWIEEKTSSTMRVAQYKLSRETGDSQDASLVLYYFGSNGGGGVSANLERWIGQIIQPDGSESKTKAKEDSLTINGLKVTTIDLSGTYSAETAPGSGQFSNNPNYRLRAAVIETPKGFYYMKLVGPEKTVAKWNSSITDFVKSFEWK